MGLFEYISENYLLMEEQNYRILYTEYVMRGEFNPRTDPNFSVNDSRIKKLIMIL